MTTIALQKQVLFDVSTPKKIWTRIENVLAVNVQQTRKRMMDKTDFQRLLDVRF